ncbi:hypothetical protein D9599_03720 [Roseomonas sp. KE2513]|nr:hypothetical protein [Roseomonas sp. KE2513]
MAGRLDLREADPKGAAIDQAMRQRMLSAYAQELSELTPDASSRWLLDRMATIESRLIAVQAAQWHAQSLPAAAAGGAGGIVAEDVVLPRRVLVTCDESMTSEGFYAVERNRAGKPFLWLGPEPHASIFIPKLVAPVEVRLHLQSAFVPDVLDEMRLSLDGGEWTQVSVEKPEGRVVLVAAPPPGAARRAASMKLEIDAIRTESPASRGGSDTRRLGIALEEIELISIDRASNL